MPTAIIKPVSVNGSPTTGVTLIGNIYTQNSSGMAVAWSNVAGNRYADFNTDAVSVLPAGAIVSNWKVRYRAARTASITNVYPYVRRNPSESAITIADWVVTTDWTTYVYPDPAGAYPDGFPLSSLNTPSAFSVFRIGGNNLSSSGTATLYIDYFEVEVIYTVPAAGTNIHLLMGDF